MKKRETDDQREIRLERARQANRRYYLANKAKFRSRYALNKEKRIDYMRDYRKKNHDKIIALNKKYNDTVRKERAKRLGL